MRNWLTARSTVDIRVIALTVGSLAYTVYVSYGSPGLAALPPIFQIVTGTISLAFLVSILEALLLRVRAGGVLGTWYYESASGNVGLGSIAISRGQIQYEFSLYQSFDDAMKNNNKLGHVESPYTSFENGLLWVNYKVEIRGTSYVAREGRLVITPPGVVDSDGMSGYWFSSHISTDADGRPVNSGELTFHRFNPKKLESLRSRLNSSE